MSADTNLLKLGEKLKQGRTYELKNSGFISDIKSRKYEFVTVIESLGDVLTNQDIKIRERGVSFLTWILMEVPSDLFNSQEIVAIVNFYCDRLKDHTSIVPATIKGLLALVKMKNIEKESLVQILMPLFRETDCQVLAKSDRYNIFLIVAYLVENHFEVVATMGFDFVFGIISIADGETDPKNLLLLFQFLPSFLKNIDLGHLMEETFDLLSCYFPVDYDTTRKNSSVTRQDLVEGLTNCLIARSDFADLCIHLIFDKLTSSSKIAKIDSYKLLEAGCSTFSVESISKHSSEIWKVMEKDLLPSKDPRISDIALGALSEVVKFFTSPESDQQSLFHFLECILSSIKNFFNIEHNMFNEAMKILLAVSAKSIPAAKYVIGNLTFVIDEVFVKSLGRKKIALTSLIPFLPILKACQIGRSNEPGLLTLFNKISQFHINALDCECPEVQKLALSGLQELVDDFNATLRDELLAAVLAICKTEWDYNRVEFLKILRQLARVAPNEMLQFVKNFPLTTEHEKDKLDLKTLAFTLSAIASEEAITQYAIPELLNIITTSEYFGASLSSLLKSIKMIDDEEFLTKIHKDYGLTETLIRWWIDGIAERKLISYAPVENLAEIIALIVRCQEICDQKSMIHKYIPLLLPGLELGSSESNVLLIEAILGSVKPIEEFDQLPFLGSMVFSLATKSDNETVRLSSSRFLASVTNRMSDNLPEWLSKACDEIFSFLNDTNPVNERKKFVFLLTWMAKGFLLADYPNLGSFIPKWFNLMEKEDIGMDVALGFKTVLEEDDSLYLNIKSHSNVKVLYRQKFFAYFPMLMTKFETSEMGKKNYIIALVWVIKSVPKHVVADELTNTIIVLSQALDTGHLEAMLFCISMLQDYLNEKEPVLVNYIYTFVPKFLKLAKLCEHMSVRIGALKCLYLYAFYPTVSILPIRKEIVKSLQSCLDDKKRLVRSEAVRSRNRWILVGAPGENNIFS